VVPGYIGARSVKWLGKIIVSDRPSTNHYVATAYKLVKEGTPEEWAAGSPIQSFPINSVTCLPVSGAKIEPGKLKVAGYALASGKAGRTIAKMELSTNNGKSWIQAKFTSKATPFCWRLWEAEIPIRKDAVILARATDSSGDVQPQNVEWNMKGYLFNAWHKTPVQVGS
ncbi:MAG: molybdopterin-dependent oxidoreductase, partial [Planctomycetales bacterium]